MGRDLIAGIAWRQLGQSLCLSPRELQIVQHVFDDHTEEAIALELGISRHTVSTYVHRLYQKLGVSSRPQLIVHIVAAYLQS
jgi:DNA-binding CsgD family transcriptional regulator